MLRLTLATSGLTLLAQLFSSQSSYSQRTGSVTDGGSTANTERAVQYFQDQLDYSTNPYGVKMVVDGNVKGVTIVDVRSRKDYAAGHIPGAINVPFDEHKGFKESNETEFKELRRDGINYVYCTSLMCNLSEVACLKFASAGYQVKEIKGGFQGWKDYSYPIAKGLN